MYLKFSFLDLSKCSYVTSVPLSELFLKLSINFYSNVKSISYLSALSVYANTISLHRFYIEVWNSFNEAKFKGQVIHVGHAVCMCSTWQVFPLMLSQTCSFSVASTDNPTHDICLGSFLVSQLLSKAHVENCISPSSHSPLHQHIGLCKGFLYTVV